MWGGEESFSNIVLWGTGERCKEYLKQKYFPDCKIVGFIDTNKSVEIFCNTPVYTPEEFIEKGILFDYIIIANRFLEEIKLECERLKFDLRKVIFPNQYMIQMRGELFTEADKIKKYMNEKQDLEEVKVISEKLYRDFLKQKKHVNRKIRVIAGCESDYVGNEESNDSILLSKEYEEMEDDAGFSYKLDYVRYRTFEFVADEIIKRNIDGAVAEVGVYRGHFAKLINEKFPSKSFYLFDTFQGFDLNECKMEILKGNCPKHVIDAFKNTSVDLVMRKMKYPKNCRIFKGYFPETARGIGKNIKFSFVSIDVDLEEAVYNSLLYFYPRLEKGGYIFLHDYKSMVFKGARVAVERYENSYGFLMAKVPIADRQGTLIITK